MLQWVAMQKLLRKELFVIISSADHKSWNSISSSYLFHHFIVVLPFRTFFSRNDVSKTHLLAFPVSRTDQTIVDPSIGSHFNYTGLCTLLRRKSFSQTVFHFIWRGVNLAVACLAWPALLAGTLLALAVAPTSANPPLAIKSNTQQKNFDNNWLFAPKTQSKFRPKQTTLPSQYL